MRMALSVVLFILAVGLGTWILICSFSTWIALWGVGGAIFDVFLLPIAVIAYPFVEWTQTGDTAAFWGYRI